MALRVAAAVQRYLRQQRSQAGETTAPLGTVAAGREATPPPPAEAEAAGATGAQGGMELGFSADSDTPEQQQQQQHKVAVVSVTQPEGLTQHADSASDAPASPQQQGSGAREDVQGSPSARQGSVAPAALRAAQGRRLDLVEMFWTFSRSQVWIRCAIQRVSDSSAHT